ncbi:MAG: hypothetical protein IPN76_35465 [Saprospiraceae bacterium]|nr:hypothetical protein [Saprospiraceae bacterium]
MKSFIDGLMKKMTVEEKIGQLNLPAAGWVPTGATVSKDSEEKIIAGKVGAMFGYHDPVKMKVNQQIAVERAG